MLTETLEITTYPSWKVYSDQMIKLSDLTLPDGTMWEALLDAQDKGIGLVHIAKLSGRIVGWALQRPAPPWEPDGAYDVKLFVDPDFRRHGIGSKLIEAATIEPGRIVVYPHDDTSDSFFGSVGVLPEDAIFCEDWDWRGVNISEWSPRGC